MKLSILIPVYNEGATIDRVLRSIVAAGLPSGIEREVVVINDGSTDRTEAELETFRQTHPEVALVYHHERVNNGKGWCLRRGIPMATGDYIVIQDADLEYDPADHPRSHAQGKKIGFRDGLRALYCIGRYTWPWGRREASAKR